MTLLGSTKLGTTVTGHSELVGLAIEQLEMDGDAVLEDEMVDRFVQCATHALPYFSSQIESTPFIKIVCEKILPLSTWSLIASAEACDQLQLKLLKVFSEMCAYCGALEKQAEKVEAVFNVLLVSFK